MARLTVPHHPDRVFKDDWWADHTGPSGYRALPTNTDPLEAFAVVLESDCGAATRSLASQMIALVEPFQRVEMWFGVGGYSTAIGFYET